MKIFVSYSRADGGEFARKVYDYFIANSQDVFTDVNNIQGGDPWSKTIEENISGCDVFIVILTFAALKSTEIEKEVMQARKDRKRIIPAKYRDIGFNEVPWGLNTYQGIEFESKDELVTRLYKMIFNRKPPKPESTPIKNLTVALLLSAVVPGWGQWYLGFRVRALIIFLIGVVVIFMASILDYAFFLPQGILFWTITIAYWAWQVFDAYTRYKKLYTGQQQQVEK